MCGACDPYLAKGCALLLTGTLLVAEASLPSASVSPIALVWPVVDDDKDTSVSVGVDGAGAGVGGVWGPMRMRTPRLHGTLWARAGADAGGAVSVARRPCCPGSMCCSRVSNNVIRSSTMSAFGAVGAEDGR